MTVVSIGDAIGSMIGYCAVLLLVDEWCCLDGV